MMSNRDLLEIVYGGDRNADLSPFLERLSDNFVLHAPGQGPVSGKYFGWDGLKEHVDDFSALSEGTFKAHKVGDILANDNHAMVPTWITAQRGSREIDMPGFGLWRFEGDRIVEHWEVACDLEAWNAFWAD